MKYVEIVDGVAINLDQLAYIERIGNTLSFYSGIHLIKEVHFDNEDVANAVFDFLLRETLEGTTITKTSNVQGERNEAARNRPKNK